MAMDEFIKKSEAVDLLRKHAVRKYPASFYLGIQAAAAEIVRLPAAVVRCGECRWHNTPGCPFNAQDRRVERPDSFFCGDGDMRQK